MKIVSNYGYSIKLLNCRSTFPSGLASLSYGTTNVYSILLTVIIGGGGSTYDSYSSSKKDKPRCPRNAKISKSEASSKATSSATSTIVSAFFLAFLTSLTPRISPIAVSMLFLFFSTSYVNVLLS